LFDLYRLIQIIGLLAVLPSDIWTKGIIVQ